MLVLPDGVFLQQPLHGHRQLPQEALDDGPTLGKLVLHFDLQDVGGQGHKVKPLWRRTEAAGSEARKATDCG